MDKLRWCVTLCTNGVLSKQAQKHNKISALREKSCRAFFLWYTGSFLYFETYLCYT